MLWCYPGRCPKNMAFLWLLFPCFYKHSNIIGHIENKKKDIGFKLKPLMAKINRKEYKKYSVISNLSLFIYLFLLPEIF